MKSETIQNAVLPARSLKDVLLNAWNKTFLTEFKFDKDNKFRFLNVFTDWPDTGRFGHKVLHFSKCFFKSIVQLPFFLIAESMSYFSNKAVSLTINYPTLVILVVNLFLLPFDIVELIANGIGIALNIVTSPISCCQEAWKINKALGVLSILTSLAIYAGIAYVASPFLLSAAFLKLVGILSGIATVGGFVSELIYSSFKAPKNTDSAKVENPPATALSQNVSSPNMTMSTPIISAALGESNQENSASVHSKDTPVKYGKLFEAPRENKTSNDVVMQMS